MADVGELVVRIKADAAQLEREMKKANQAVKQNAGQMSGAFRDLKSQLLALAPALSVGALVAFGRAAFTQADHINDLAQRTGFLGSTLSALNIPLKQSGSSLDEFTSSMVRMNNAVGEAGSDSGSPLLKTFNSLELSVQKLSALSPEQQFYEIARALNDVKSQSEFTRLGIDIFGRSFATIAPLIRQSNGDLAAFVETAKAGGNALTDDQLKRIDDFGDKWTEAVEKLKLTITGAMPLLEKFVELADWVNRQNVLNSLAATGIAAGSALGAIDPEIAEQALLEAGDRNNGGSPLKLTVNPAGKGSARGGNQIKDTKLDSARKALEDYNRSLREQNDILHHTPREQAAVEARYKTLELAQKAGIKNTDALVAANEDLARSNYDIAQSMQEAARFQQELHDKLSDSLADIVFSFDSASDSARRFAESIAKTLIERKITGPLADALIGTGGGSGMLDGLFSNFGGFFANGGNPPVGVPSVVGENGPEIFVPRVAGTIIPNGAGGGGVQFTQVINVSPGVPELIRSEINRAAPAISSHAQAGVFAAIERGGRESRLVGRKS